MDGEPTFKLEACVHELRGRTAVKKGASKKAVSVVAAETQEGHQQSPRHRTTQITSPDPVEWTSGLPPQETVNILPRNKNLAKRRKGMNRCSGLCEFNGLAHQTHRSIRLW